MAEIGIVIVNYNGEKFQNKCIRSIYESTFKDIEIVVVDSGSSDKSIEMLYNEFPDVHIIEMEDNVGVAAGNNIGIRYCLDHEDEYIMLMNNDIEIAPDMIEIMYRHADNNTIIVPKIYYYDPHNVIWFAGGELDWKHGCSVHIGLNEIDKGQYDQKKSISYAPTCSMLLHQSVFQIIVEIDERYFMYFDDTDLCARISQVSDYNIKYVPEAVMWHKVSSSSGSGSKLKIYYQTRNKLIFINKFKNKTSVYTYLYTYVQMLARFIKSPFKYKNYSVIPKAYMDYKHNRLYKNDNKL